MELPALSQLTMSIIALLCANICQHTPFCSSLDLRAATIRQVFVERKNGVVKAILAKLADENSKADVATLVARAGFLSNMFSGNRLLSSF